MTLSLYFADPREVWTSKSWISYFYVKWSVLRVAGLFRLVDYLNSDGREFYSAWWMFSWLFLCVRPRRLGWMRSSSHPQGAPRRGQDWPRVTCGAPLWTGDCFSPGFSKSSDITFLGMREHFSNGQIILGEPPNKRERPSEPAATAQTLEEVGMATGKETKV